MKINGVVLTNTFANAAFLLFEVKTAVIDINNQGNGLGEVYVDGFAVGYILIESIGDLDRAIFHAGRTTRALVLDHVSGLLNQGDPKVACLPFHPVNFGIAENLYVWMPADLDQFGRKNSHGTVIGGIGLVKLRHMPANGRCLFNQVDLETRRCQIKRGLNAADSTANHHDVSKLIVPQSTT